MKQCLADPCVFYLRDKNDEPKLIAVMTVDDCLLAGKPVDMKWLQDEVNKYFKITHEMVVKKHLGIDYEWKQDSEGEICPMHNGEGGQCDSRRIGSLLGKKCERVVYSWSTKYSAGQERWGCR